MKKLHLHIGSYKTGTSSIQELLHSNRGTLAKQGFCYPGNEVNHHKLFFVTQAEESDCPRQFKGVKRKGLRKNIEQYFTVLEKYMRSYLQQQIISTEYLFIAKQQYIRNVLAYLRQFFDDIEVYLFVRNPVDYYKSMQQQMIKARSYITPPARFRYKFRKVIKAWGEFCEVNVLEYSKNRDSNKVFCERIGLNTQQLSFAKRRKNSSLAIEQMLLLEKLQQNIYPDKEGCFKSHLDVISNIRDNFSHRPELKEYAGCIVRENHYEDLQWLKKQFSINYLDHQRRGAMAENKKREKGKKKCSVRDVYQVDEQSVELYEASLINQLLKNMVEN